MTAECAVRARLLKSSSGSSTAEIVSTSTRHAEKMEALHKLESVDNGESRSSVSRLQRRLAAGRDPGLLADLVDGYFAKGSKRVLKILTSLKDVQSQDLFDKLHECIHRRSTRLAVLRLLAHTLNTQTSWMYKIVDHPLFQAILYFLKTSGDVVVLVSGVLVVVAILPLVPSHLPRHQPDLFEIFTDLATIRQTNRLGLTPQELYLHLDLAVYHLFLQLYAMFPCSLFQYLRARYGPTGAVEEFQEYIGPLFHQVQMHPSLVTDAPSYEASKAKWGSMEPHEIATLSLSMCLDPAIAPQEEDPGPSVPKPEPLRRPRDGPSSVARKLRLPLSDAERPPISIQVRNSPDSSGAATTSLHRTSPPPGLQQPSSTNPAGLKSAQELSEFWSPSVTFGQVTPGKLSQTSSRHSMVSHSGQNTSTFSSPRSDSATSSVQHTPGPANPAGPVFTFNKNYSPTASVEGEPLHARQLSSLTHSAIHTPSHHEEPVTGAQYDTLSQSMRTDSSHHSGGASRSPSSPIKVVKRGFTDSQQLNQSLKVKFEKLIGIFSPRRRTDTLNSQSSEEFTEIFMPKSERGKLDQRASELDAELGEDCLVGEEPLSSEPGERVHLDLSREGNDAESGNEGEGVTTMEGDAATPCVGFEPSEDQLELGFHRDSRRFSHNGTVERTLGSAKGESDPPKEPRYSSSFPGQPPTRTRSRNTNSEPTATQTVHLVQARLQRLVESSQTIAEGEAEPEERTQKHPPLYATDSTATLLASSPPVGGDYSRLLMRRVSVCKGLGAGEIGGRLESLESQPHPSPAVLLDQFVSHGEILHRGSAQDIPLTELEGVDWGFFGGCPHSEELGVMQSQVALLHSQLLFERHQCLQHARRNRRLLSKARSGLQLREELVSLREQVQSLHSVNRSLQEEQLKKTVQEGGGARAGTWENSSAALAAENAQLRDANFRLAEEVKVLTQQNETLSTELRGARERVFSLESERAHLQPQLAQARDLQQEVAFLTQQLQVTGELLYQQKQEGGVALLDQGGREKQWELLHQTLLKEKEEAECRVLSLQSELQCWQGQLSELQCQLAAKELEAASLQDALGLLQGNCREKIRATEEKYEAMCLISQQLESHVMELRGRAALRRKPHHRHKRSSSHPTGRSSHTPSTSATNTPSPISLQAQQHSPS